MYQIMKFKGPITQKNMRVDLAQLLVQPLLDAQTIQPELPGPGRLAANLDRLKGKHFRTGSKKGNTRGRCKVGAKQKKPNGKYRDTKTANYCECCGFLVRGTLFSGLPHRMTQYTTVYYKVELSVVFQANDPA